ncbi:MAG: hypothetical protein R3A79_06785 [Nannocystaceae bacterium]
MSAPLALALATTIAVSGSPPPPGDGEIPGGYFEFGEIREREPEDGDKNVLIGSILFPLGFLRAGAGAAMLVTAAPDRCKQSYGEGVRDSTCSGLRIYSWVGIGYGGLMLVTGAVFLGWGLSQRSRHRAWKRRNNIAVAPMIGRDGGGLRFGLRF